jgi:hypothetical protein
MPKLSVLAINIISSFLQFGVFNYDLKIRIFFGQERDAPMELKN